MTLPHCPLCTCNKWRYSNRLILPDDESRRELVLALDGGGMRGYSSLLIIEALMAQIHEAERGHNMALNDDTSTSLLAKGGEYLPAHYFDYAFGTSTGGLIAIMLGRLRMKIADCLNEYEDFGDKVFGKRRLFRFNQYDDKVLESVVKEVIKKYTKESPEEALFTQAEKGRRTCRTGVVAVRRVPGASDDAFIFRSYKFTGGLQEDRPLANTRPFNPEGNGKVYVWQAARATSAAPHYFRDIEINGDRFMDGAVQFNNPSFRAWCEATAMHHVREEHNATTDRGKQAIGVFVSIGTGKSAPLTMFNDKNFIRQLARIGKAAIKRLSNPEETHDFLRTMFAGTGVSYYRFNVPTGLEHVKMDDSREQTMFKIQKATKAYLADPEVKKELRQCAERLVAHRRGRNPTDEERRLRDIHSSLYNSDGDSSGDETFHQCKVCRCQLNTPISGFRSRSVSGSTGPRPVVAADDGLLHADGPSRSRSDSGVGSSRGRPQCGGICPATGPERELATNVLRLRSSSRTLTTEAEAQN